MESFGIAKRTVSPVVEDYSDLAIDDDEEAHLLEKVADFKVGLEEFDGCRCSQRVDEKRD
jgi:hypothetical protein